MATQSTPPSPAIASADPTRKFTTEADLDAYQAALLQNFEKRKDNPTGFIYQPINMQPEFHGATESETIMKFLVMKYHVKDGKATEAVTDVRDSETSRMVYCEDFLRDHKRI